MRSDCFEGLSPDCGGRQIPVPALSVQGRKSPPRLKRQVIIRRLFKWAWGRGSVPQPPLYCRREWSLVVSYARAVKGATGKKALSASISADIWRRRAKKAWNRDLVSCLFLVIKNCDGSGYKGKMPGYGAGRNSPLCLPIGLAGIIIRQRILLVSDLGGDEGQQLVGLIKFLQYKIA